MNTAKSASRTRAGACSSAASLRWCRCSSTPRFVLSDWVLVGGVYRLDLQHNLETLNVLAEFFENSNIQVFADRFEVLNTNTIRIYTTMDPDCRFEGKAVVVPV